MINKRLALLVVCLIIFSTVGSSIYAEPEDIKPSIEPEVKIVTIGYALEDKEDIFGSLSDKEIDKILQEETEKLMESKGNEKETSHLQNIKKSYGDKLIISIVHKDLLLNNSNGVKKMDITKPLSYDEYPVSRIFRYKVGFYIPGLGTAYGGYESLVKGIVSRVSFSAIIEDLITTNVEFARFPVRDYSNGTNKAYNIFYNIDLQQVSLGRGDFSISPAGDITFHGVR